MKNTYKILVCPANEGGCAYYRAINPFMKLAEVCSDRVQVRFDKNPLGINEETGQWQENWDFESMKWADIVMTQNISNFGGPYTARVVGKAQEFGKFVHYDTDDLLTELYEGHRLQDVYKNKGLSDITRFIYNHSDLVTVTQKKFAHRIAPYCNNTLAVIKNSIDYDLQCWRVPPVPQPKIRKNRICRIGWAGGIHHEEDVKEFAGVPNLVNQRAGRERIQWNFYGRPPETGKEQDQWQLDVWDNYRKILMRGFKGSKNWFIHPAMAPDAYGVMYANMDIAIAPLQMNEFNDSKSEIKVAECGRYKVPLVASDVGCYGETIENWETGVLIPPEEPKSEWVKVLSRLIRDNKLRKRMGENLYDLTEEYFNLNKVVHHRVDLYDECFKKLEAKVGS